MTRKDFLKNCAGVGLGLPFLSMLLTSCDKEEITLDNPNFNFSGKVLVIGAGAAGLTAGHILKQNNIDFQIIEASSVYGGRVKKTASLADFPIDLGAEWIHTEPSILAEILNDPNANMEVETIVYSPETISIWKNEKLRKRNIFSNFYSEHKFKSTTWYGFFEKFIVPAIHDNITFNSPVSEIDYSGDKILVTTNNNQVFEGDKIVITVPIPILQSNIISFQPSLPTAKIAALDEVYMPDGLKVFIEFSEKFYPDLTYIGGLDEILNGSSEKIFYDAAFRKDTNKNVLGLFTIGEYAAAYTSLEDDEIIQKVMGELDVMFDGKASQFYQNHIIQNWSKEPYIRGSYSHYSGDETTTMETLFEPIDNKVFFAGEAFSPDSSATVHGAAETAYTALEMMFQT